MAGTKNARALIAAGIGALALAWNYLVAFAFLGVAAFFAFAFTVPKSVI